MSEHNKNQTDESLLVAMSNQISMVLQEMQTLSTKIEGRGGLFDRVESAEKDIKSLTEHKNKAVGGIMMLSAICGAIGAIITKIWK